MLNKEYIESLLKEEETVKRISIARTQFSPMMSEFYFFNTFFQVLKSLGIDCNGNKQQGVIDGSPVLFCYISFRKDGETYTTEYDNEKLLNDLQSFNDLQCNMSMIESTSTLIDIFLSLLL